MAPEVTVVIPTQNRQNRLMRTLRSALAQEGVDLEVVVVDDGSIDGTEHAVNRLGEPNVRVLRHGAAAGVARARNTGLGAAAGHWVAFLDDDDLWAPGKLRAQLDAVAAAPSAWAYTAAVCITEDGADAELHAELHAVLGQGTPLLDALLAGANLPAGASTVLARTDGARRAGGFDERLKHIADWDLWVRLAAESEPAALEEPLVAYVEHDEAMHYDPDVDAIVAELDYVGHKHRELAASRGVAIDDRPFWGWLAANQRRAGRRWQAGKVELAAGVRHRDLRSVVRATASIVTRPDAGAANRCPMPAWVAAYV